VRWRESRIHAGSVPLKPLLCTKSVSSGDGGVESSRAGIEPENWFDDSHRCLRSHNSKGAQWTRSEAKQNPDDNETRRHATGRHDTYCSSCISSALVGKLPLKRLSFSFNTLQAVTPREQ
jgi:hypothetical protein